MADGVFHHVGVPTTKKRDGETYLEDAKLYLTDCQQHPYCVEFLRFAPDSPMPEMLKTHVHSAFMVPDLAKALEGKDVLLEPFCATDTLRVAFITDGEALIELMETI